MIHVSRCTPELATRVAVLVNNGQALHTSAITRWAGLVQTNWSKMPAAVKAPSCGAKLGSPGQAHHWQP
jgi:hypothetical protein